MRLGWYRAVHVKNIEMQRMRALLSNRKLLKRKLIDIENHIRGALRAYGLLIGAVARWRYEARSASWSSIAIPSSPPQCWMRGRQSSWSTKDCIKCSYRWFSMIRSAVV
jgi:transposase